MLSVLNYSKKEITRATLDDINPLIRFYFIDVLSPDLKELRSISEKLNISITDLKNCLDPKERSRIENKEGYSLIIFRMPVEKSTVPLGIIIGRKFLITVHKDEILFIKDIIASKDISMFKDVSYFTYNLLFEIIKNFSSSVNKISEQLDHTEESILKPGNKKTADNIFLLKKELLYLRKDLISNRDVINSLNKISLLKNTDFSNLNIEVIELIDVEELSRDRLTSILDIYLLSISNKLNEVMKSFTVIASLLLVPMLISGIYGMNLIYLPLAKNTNSFWIILLIMVVSTSLMILLFKKKQWI